jgi:hypothetical protein
MQPKSAKELRERHEDLRREINNLSNEIVLVSQILAAAISPFAVGDTIMNLSSKVRVRVHKFIGVCDHISIAGNHSTDDTVTLQGIELDSNNRPGHLVQVHVFNVGKPYCMWIKEEK